MKEHDQQKDDHFSLWTKLRDETISFLLSDNIASYLGLVLREISHTAGLYES